MDWISKGYAQLGDGNRIPWIGYGSAKATESGVSHALHSGYKHIDTAEGYRNEEAIGNLLAERSAAASTAGEDKFEMPFITTKLWPVKKKSTKSFDEIIASCEESLSKLRVPCVDLYLIHAPLAGPEKRIEQWRALVQLKERGKCKSIGVSNYSVQHLEEIRAAGLPMPAANQLELHPLCQHRDIIEYCRQHSILPIAYSSLAPLSSWRPQQMSAKQTMQPAEMQQPELLDALAAKYNCTPAQILLMWGLQHGYPILPKSNTLQRVQQNHIINQLAIFDATVGVSAGAEAGAGGDGGAGQGLKPLTEEDMSALDALDQNKSFAWPKGDPCLTP